MTLHFVSAGMCALVLLLYFVRLGQMHGHLTFWEHVVRLGLAVLVGTIALGFLDLGLNHAPFEWRHYPILAALCAVAGGYVGLLWPRRHR